VYSVNRWYASITCWSLYSYCMCQLYIYGNGIYQAKSTQKLWTCYNSNQKSHIMWIKNIADHCLGQYFFLPHTIIIWCRNEQNSLNRNSCNWIMCETEMSIGRCHHFLWNVKMKQMFNLKQNKKQINVPLLSLLQNPVKAAKSAQN